MSSETRIEETIVLEGHIIDSFILPRVFDTIMDHGGDFSVEEMTVGQTKTDVSRARLKVFAKDEASMGQILTTLQTYGAELVSASDVQTMPAPKDGALPSDFYSTTNLPTQVRLGGSWVDVSGEEMDLAIVVDRDRRSARTVPIADVTSGAPKAVGHEGIRVKPLQRERHRDEFSFMQNAVSSDRSAMTVLYPR